MLWSVDQQWEEIALKLTGDRDVAHHHLPVLIEGSTTGLPSLYVAAENTGQLYDYGLVAESMHPRPS